MTKHPFARPHRPGFASLCVLSFNRPQFLRAMIESMAANANYPFELVIHDDGSIDPEVYALLDMYREHGGFSTIITNTPGQNQGQGVALNRMFNLAQGDPIIKLDQDLVFASAWLETTVRILETNQAKHYAAPGDADGHEEPLIGLLGLLHYYLEPVDSRVTKVSDHGGYSRHTHILGSGFALTRECWEELGPFEEHSDAFAEDHDMQRRVHESGDFICALPTFDLVNNTGMGPGPSTIVSWRDEPGGEVDIAKIHHGPYIFGGVA